MIGIFVSLALMTPFHAVADSELPSDVDLTKFRDIKPHQMIPVSPADTSSSIVVPVLIGIALLGGIALVFWYIYRRSPDSRLLAMAEIDRLESQYSADPSQAYDQLSAIVRQAISSRGSANAMTQTTNQVIDSLQASSATELVVAQVGNLLRLADETKFAGGLERTALPDECVFDLTRSIVQIDSGQSVKGAKGDE